MLATIREEIDAVESPMLADVTSILDRYGIAQTIVEGTGCTVQYTTLDQEEAAVRKDT